MKTKVLYVLVSNQEDVFLEQTYISIYSLRKHNPSVHVTILIDDVTDESLCGIRANILKLIDEKIVVNLDRKLTNKYKSRVLKTNMRNYVDGDFLYIDSDTIILSDLSEADTINEDIAAVFELNRCIKDNLGRKSAIEPLERIGGHLDESDEYYNSGVIFVKDNAETKNFFQSWYNTWQEGTKVNVFFDQPALGVLNHKLGNKIKQLSGDWNCQGRYGARYYRTAKIFHYLYDASFDHPLMSKNLFKGLKDNGTISDEIEGIISNPFIFMSPINEVLTGNDIALIHSRYYSAIRSFQRKCPQLFNGIDGFNERVYQFFLKYIKRKRNLTPPR